MVITFTCSPTREVSSRAGQTARDLTKSLLITQADAGELISLWATVLLVEDSDTNGMNNYFVYMLTNRSRVVLYTGVTNSLERRLWFHENTPNQSFVKRYNVDRLVYYECFDRVGDAISREKEIKAWRREKKNDLVRKMNPKWEDLGKKLFGDDR